MLGGAKGAEAGGAEDLKRSKVIFMEPTEFGASASIAIESDSKARLKLDPTGPFLFLCSLAGTIVKLIPDGAAEGVAILN